VQDKDLRFYLLKVPILLLISFNLSALIIIIIIIIIVHFYRAFYAIFKGAVQLK
jgi:hypothetical protein